MRLPSFRAVHVRLKFKPELHLLFMVFSVLSVLFLKLETHLSFVHPFFFERFSIFLEIFHILLDGLLVVGLLGELRLVIHLHILNLALMLL